MFLLTICFSLVCTEIFFLECDGLLCLWRFMQNKYKRHAPLYPLNNLTTRFFLNIWNFAAHGVEQKNVRVDLNWVYPVQCFPLESAVKHYDSSSFFFSRCSMAEVRAIPGSFKNVIKLNFAAFLRRLFILENRRTWKWGLWESMDGVVPPAQDSVVCVQGAGSQTLTMVSLLVQASLPAGILGYGKSSMGWASSAQQCFVLPVSFLWLKSTTCPLETSVKMSKPGKDHLGLMLLSPGTILSLWAFVIWAGGGLGREEASLSPRPEAKRAGKEKRKKIFACCQLAIGEIYISSTSRDGISNKAQRLPLRNLSFSSMWLIMRLIAKKTLQVLAVGSRWGAALLPCHELGVGWTEHPSETGGAGTLQLQPQTSKFPIQGKWLPGLWGKAQ